MKFLVFMPPIFMFFYILNYGVDVPFGDQWDTPGITLIEFFQGTLNFQSLISQHNESRLFFPRLAFLGLAQLGGWNVKQEMFLSLILVSITYWNTYKLIQYSSGARMTWLKWLGLLCIGLLLFSPAQRENWLWGIQSITFFPAMTVTSCTVLAYSKMKPLVKFLFSLALCTVATFTYANGILTWVLVLPVLLWSEYQNHRRPSLLFSFLGGWIGVFSINFILYFHDYSKPAHHPSFWDALQSPWQSLVYFLSFMGGPLGRWVDIEGRVVIGGLFIFFYFLLLGLFYFQKKNISSFFSETLGWQTIATYSLVSGLVTTLGRAGFGVEQSMTGRYITFSTYFYVAIVGLVVVLISSRNSRKRFLENPDIPFEKSLRKLCIFISILFFCLYTLTAIPSTRWGYVSKLDRLQGKSCLLFLDVIYDPECIEKHIYPIADLPKTRLPILQEAGFLTFERMATRRMQDLVVKGHDGGPVGAFSDLQAPAAIDEIAIPDETLAASRQANYVATGWVKPAQESTEFDAVILAYRHKASNQDIGFKFAGLTPRFDVPNLQGDLLFLEDLSAAQDLLVWQTGFPSSVLPESACQISAWAFDIESLTVWELATQFNVCG
jgi:hypothetical protein